MSRLTERVRREAADLAAAGKSRSAADLRALCERIEKLEQLAGYINAYLKHRSWLMERNISQALDALAELEDTHELVEPPLEPKAKPQHIHIKESW